VVSSTALNGVAGSPHPVQCVVDHLLSEADARALDLGRMSSDEFCEVAAPTKSVKAKPTMATTSAITPTCRAARNFVLLFTALPTSAQPTNRGADKQEAP